ncbi:MAG: hypothetical protein KC561_05870, partial [Myxococcales bacterium]|nr:hypothetical protein [Myxococcales bacterium]
MSQRMLGALLFVLTLCTATTAFAGSPIPEWNQTRVAASGVQDTFDPLRTYLETFESAVGAEYHVAIVEFTDRLNRPGPDYGDRNDDYLNPLLDAWEPFMDPEAAIVILISTSNRDVIVYPSHRWSQMGWERQSVTNSIESTADFSRHARAGDMNQAVIALIRSIERELGNRVERRARELEQAAGRIAAFETLEAEVRAQIEVQTPDGREALGARFERALQYVETARTLHAAEVGHRSALMADEGIQILEDIREDIQTRPELRERLQEAIESHSSSHVATDLANLSGWSEQPLNEVAENLISARTALEEWDGRRAEGLLASVEAQLESYDRNLESTQHSRFITGRVIPAIMLGCALLIFFIWMGAQSKRRWSLVEAHLEFWKEKLGFASTRLLKFEDEHALLLSMRDLTSRFKSATNERAVGVAEIVDDLYIAFEAATGIVQRGEEWFKSRYPFTPFKAARALKRLTTDLIQFSTTQVSENRLFLPEQRELSMTSSSLIEHLESQYADAVEKASTLEKDLLSAWNDLGAATNHIANARAAIELGISVGLDTKQWQAALQELSRALDDAKKRSDADPLGTAPEVSELLPRAATLDADTSAIATKMSAREKLESGLQALEQRIAELRKEGSFLSEPGFEPEAMADHIRAEVDSALEAAKALDASSVETHFSEAEDTSSELSQLIEETVTLKETGMETASSIAERLDQLEGLRPEKQEQLATLRGQFAEESLHPAADNIQEVASAIASGRDAIALAKSNFDSKTQHYLAGGELLRRATALCETTDSLYAEISSKGQELQQLRNETKARIEPLERSIDELA